MRFISEITRTDVDGRSGPLGGLPNLRRAVGLKFWSYVIEAQGHAPRTVDPYGLRRDAAENVVRLWRGASVSGRLTDGAGCGLPAVAVQADGPAPYRRRAVRTAAEGAFALDHLPAGRWTLTFLDAGRGLAGRAELDVRGDVTLGDVPLSVGGVIRGRASDADGRPLAGVRVGLAEEAHVARDLVQATGAGTHSARWARTDEEGRFRFTGCRPEGHRLELVRQGSELPSAVARDVRPDGAPLELAIEGEAGGVCLELVRDDGGATDEPLLLWSDRLARHALARRDGSGDVYRAEGLVPGTWRVVLVHDPAAGRTYVPLGEVEVREGLTQRARVRVPLTGSVRLEVLTPSGQPGSGGHFRLDADSPFVCINNRAGRLGITPLGPGVWLIDGVSEGTHRLEFADRGKARVARQVEVRGGEVTHLSLRLERPRSLRTNVLLPQDEEGVRDLVVRVEDAEGEVLEERSERVNLPARPRAYRFYPDASELTVVAELEGHRPVRRTVRPGERERLVRLRVGE